MCDKVLRAAAACASHADSLRADTGVFFRVLGVGLLAVSLVGLIRMVGQLLR